jgi:RimJ/RimL family protein N-acetyltransferase
MKRIPLVTLTETDPASGLPIGPRVDATPARRPERVTLTGPRVIIAPIDPEAHTEALYASTRGPEGDRLWLYLYDGPYADREALRASLAHKAASSDPLYFAILDAATGQAVGHAAYLRIEPAHRCIEVGGILYTAALQRTPAATEAMYLMARHVFEDLGYRRYEWKCNALNAASQRAARRLGFTFEGIFRQHTIAKGRNRDTAWFSMLDREWPARKAAFERWLAADNFDEQGRQRTSLAELNASAISMENDTAG